MTYSNNITVSVIIPAYNRAYLITGTIDSVLAQTYPHFEIIVVDDGSTDKTQEVVNNIKDARIKYIRHEINRGVGEARNTGINAASGEYIAFLDDDDEWLPMKLEKQMNIMNDETQDVSIVYTLSIMPTDDGFQYIPLNGPKEGNIFESVLGGDFPQISTLLIKKQCLLAGFMFDETIRFVEDWDLLIRLSKHYKFRVVPEHLAFYHRMPDSVATRKYIIRGYKIIISKHFIDLKNNGASLHRLYLGLGHNLCMDGNMKEGRHYFMQALKNNPFNIKATASLIIALLGSAQYKKVIDVYQNATTGKTVDKDRYYARGRGR